METNILAWTKRASSVKKEDKKNCGSIFLRQVYRPNANSKADDIDIDLRSGTSASFAAASKRGQVRNTFYRVRRFSNNS